MYPLPFKSLPSFLDEHQQRGVLHILSRSRSYLAHAPGAGKTVQAITASLYCETKGQTLFIVPPTLTINWEREILKWTEWTNTWFSISIIPRKKGWGNIDWGADFIICPDSMLTRPYILHHLQSIPFKFVAVDEASRFKESTSKRTMALFGGTFKVKQKPPARDITLTSYGLIQDAKHAVLLDGSPMPNRPMELWAPTSAMDPASIDFKSYDDFGYRYCGPTINPMGQWEYKHSSHEAELKEKLQKHFMHVVSESELKHPERRRSLLYMSEDPRTPDIRAWEQKNLGGFDFDTLDEDTAHDKELATWRKDIGIAKAPWVSNYVKERLQSKNESILLFTWHRDVTLHLRDSLREFAPLVVMGGTSKDDREAAFRNFQNGNSKLLIGNISAMGRGHNLQRASRCVFAEYSWCGETNIQAEKRASRKGNDQAFVRCDYVVLPGSLDELILEAVFRKEKTVGKVIG